MINRAKMPRQLRNKGGITNVVPRELIMVLVVKLKIELENLYQMN